MIEELKDLYDNLEECRDWYVNKGHQLTNEGDKLEAEYCYGRADALTGVLEKLKLIR